MLTQPACSVQGPQWGIGLHRLPEFWVEAQVVGLAEQDLSHATLGDTHLHSLRCTWRVLGKGECRLLFKCSQFFFKHFYCLLAVMVKISLTYFRIKKGLFAKASLFRKARDLTIHFP